jgi:hypothetical protein
MDGPCYSLSLPTLRLQIRAVYQNNVRSEVGEGRDSMANVLSFATSIGT